MQKFSHKVVFAFANCGCKFLVMGISAKFVFYSYRTELYKFNIILIMALLENFYKDTMIISVIFNNTLLNFKKLDLVQNVLKTKIKPKVNCHLCKTLVSFIYGFKRTIKQQN